MRRAFHQTRSALELSCGVRGEGCSAPGRHCGTGVGRIRCANAPSIIAAQQFQPPFLPSAKGLEELGSNDPSTRIHAELQSTNFLVNILHELHNEVDQAMFKHRLGVKIGN